MKPLRLLVLAIALISASPAQAAHATAAGTVDMMITFGDYGGGDTN